MFIRITTNILKDPNVQCIMISTWHCQVTEQHYRVVEEGGGGVSWDRAEGKRGMWESE
jgi:hypothetical protein